MWKCIRSKKANENLEEASTFLNKYFFLDSLIFYNILFRCITFDFLFQAQETRNNNANSTLNRKSKSKENLSSYHTLRRSREELSKGSNSTLYKKKERLPRENSRYTREKEDKKISAKSLSVESLGNSSKHSRRSGDGNRDISRSVSMPRDPEKSAGWFKISKKNKVSGSTPRLWLKEYAFYVF